jgi:hypothetical protein
MAKSEPKKNKIEVYDFEGNLVNFPSQSRVCDDGVV